MDQTHAAALGGGSALTMALAGVLTGFHGHDATWAGYAAFLIIAVFCFLYAIVAWWIKWKDPSAPALPDLTGLSAGEAAVVAQQHAAIAQHAAAVAQQAANTTSVPASTHTSMFVSAPEAKPSIIVPEKH